MRLRFAVPALAFVVASLIHSVPASADTAPEKGGAASAKGGSDETAALQALDKKWAESFMKKDVAGIAEYYADDAVVMDPGPELMIQGKDKIKSSFGSFLSSIESISFSMSDTKYHTAGNLGYGYGTFEMSYKDKKSGKTVSTKGRALTVFEKRGGKWLAVADHASFPMPAEPPQ